MATESELENHQFGQSIGFIMDYSPEKNIVDEATHTNLKEMLVSYFTQEKELNEVNAELDSTDEQLTVLLLDNQSYLNEADQDKIEGSIEEKIIALTRVISEIQDAQSGEQDKHLTRRATMVDKIEELENKLEAATYELNDKVEAFDRAQEEKEEYDMMLKEMDYKFDRLRNELVAKDKELKETAFELNSRIKRFETELMESKTECETFKDLYNNSLKSIREFKSDNSEKFKTMMQEQEILKTKIADFRMNESELEKTISHLRAENTEKSKALTSIQTKEFILKQQLQSKQDQLQEEIDILNNEIEDLAANLERERAEKEELEEEVEALRASGGGQPANQTVRPSVFQGVPGSLAGLGDVSLVEGGGKMNNLLSELEEFNGDATMNIEETERELNDSTVQPAKPLETETTAGDEEEPKETKQEPEKKILDKNEMIMALSNLVKSRGRRNRNVRRRSTLVGQGTENPLAKTVKTYEKRIEGMNKISANLQRRLGEEKKKNQIVKKFLKKKDREIEDLRQKIMELTENYGHVTNELNQELEASLERSRVLKMKLRKLRRGAGVRRSMRAALKDVKEICDEPVVVNGKVKK